MRCPRCGEGKLFNGFLALAPRCDVCWLDYSFADPADGPAFFVICFTCVPAIALAVSIEVHFPLPWWVHAITSLPVILLFCIPPLRPLKGWLVASQYFYKGRKAALRPLRNRSPSNAIRRKPPGGLPRWPRSAIPSLWKP
jgi:uncharacterized protein (DUF983 family)